ncbi:MAG: hypothetical protein A4E74_00047 [Syntrophus sp. PtaB.Bin075]|nr:MAG: hypothetical protein A4E74_00047 [Syntrophus sp. PtaB.Bin075]
MKLLWRIRQLSAIGLLISSLLAVSAIPLFAEEEKPTADLSVSTLTKYVWRGQELSRNSIVLQPSATIGYRDFSVNLWGNLDTSPCQADKTLNDSDNWTETDITLGYNRAFGPVTAGVGYIYYALSALQAGGRDLPDSQEVYASLGVNALFSPTLTVYKEISHYKQWYFLLGMSHAFALNDRVTLKLAATASYLKSGDSDDYPEIDSDYQPTGDEYNNFHDGVLSMSLPVTLVKHLTVTPSLSYVFPLCEDAKHEMKYRGLQGDDPSNRDSSYLYGGLTVSFAF